MLDGGTGRDQFPQSNTKQMEEESSIEIQYEQKLRALFFETVTNSAGTVADNDEWELLISMLLDEGGYA